MTSFKAISLLLISLAVNALADSAAEKFWPQWRGPLATGVAPFADPPLTWSETKNVKWKLAIPGEGDATPIIWGDRVFVLSAIPSATEPTSGANGPATNKAFRFTVICIDR